MSKNIPVSQSQQPLRASPFAGLDVGPLPPGPERSGATGPETKAVRGRVVLRREKSRRGGKTVIVVGDFDARISEGGIAELARKARKACGCGGTVAGREIELQGDDPARARKFLEAEGFRVAGV